MNNIDETALAAAVEADPQVVIGRGWSRGAVALGLDNPVELRGGSRLHIDAVPTAVPLDWNPEVASIVAQSCRTQQESGRTWFHLPPLALVGLEGCGRTHVARQIARYAGVPLIHVDLEVDDGEWCQIAPTGPEVTMPNNVTLGIAASRCANPVVHVTGVEKAKGADLMTLSAMIEPRSASRFVDEAIEATIDLSHVTWLVDVPDVNVLPLPLAKALTPISFQAHSAGVSEELQLSIATEILDDLGLKHLPHGCSWMKLREETRHTWPIGREGRVTVLYREMRSLIEAAVATAGSQPPEPLHSR